MDCLRSGLEVLVIPTEFDEALDGRAEGWEEPKKSRPSRESPGLLCFAGAGGPAFATGLELGVSVVLGLIGGAGMSSPNRSMVGAACRCGCGCCGAEEIRCDADLSIFAFSWTRLSGTLSSPSTSRVAGSGMPPSITHRLDSYLVLMKFSIFASDGTCPAASLASQYLFALELPHLSTLCSCSSVQESRSTDFIRLTCVPSPR